MNKNSFSCSIQNLKLMPPTPNRRNNKFIITSMSPFQIDKISFTRPELYFYTNKRKIKMTASFVKSFSSHNNRYNTNYYTIFSKTDLYKKNNKYNNCFPGIRSGNSLSTDKISCNRTNISERMKNLSSIYKKLKFGKNFLKRENLYFMKEKKSEIQNIHTNLMKRNELYILTNQNIAYNSDFKNNEEEKNKIGSNAITEDNKASFENEYNKICKNKLKEKNLIKNEINNIGKEMSWIINFKKNIENNKDKMMTDMTDEEKKKEEDRKKIEENINNSIFVKRIKGKDPVLEINHTSTFPIIGDDKKLLSNLWKKDMMKYYKHIMDNKKSKNNKFLSDLLDVYD
jgi:hypothetical protein